MLADRRIRIICPSTPDCSSTLSASGSLKRRSSKVPPDPADATGGDIEAAFLGRYRSWPEPAGGSTVADCREAVMSMSEYEERLRPPVPSLHQIFAAARGRDRGRRWRRCVLFATAVLGMVTMTCKVVPHHPGDSLAGIQGRTGDGLPIAY